MLVDKDTLQGPALLWACLHVLGLNPWVTPTGVCYLNASVPTFPKLDDAFAGTLIGAHGIGLERPFNAKAKWRAVGDISYAVKAWERGNTVVAASGRLMHEAALRCLVKMKHYGQGIEVPDELVSKPQVMHPVDGAEESYASASGFTMQREDGQTPNGNPMAQRWVLRDAAGVFVDFDSNRHDLMERHGLKTHY